MERLDGAARKDRPVGGDVGKLDALTVAGEDHRVLADDVAAAQCGKADIAAVARRR